MTSKFKAGKVIKQIERSIKLNRDALLELQKIYKIMKERSQKVIKELQANLPEELLKEHLKEITQHTQQMDEFAHSIKNYEIEIKRLETLRYRMLTYLFT